MRIITLFNPYDNNSLSLNLFAKIARTGKNVLYLDFRTKGNFEKNVGLNSSSFLSSKGDISKHIVNLEKNFDIVKGSVDLNLQEFSQFERFVKFSDFESLFINLNYDYIFIELTPNLDLFTMNSLFVSSEVMVYTSDKNFNFIYSLANFLSQFNKLYSKKVLLTKVITYYEGELGRDKYARVVFDFTSRVVAYPILFDKKSKEFSLSLEKITQSIVDDEKDLGNLSFRNKKVEHEYLLMLDRIAHE